ncbi:MAG TPA: CHAT domain-containing protein, partial [Thermomicrobiales bacterium]|nr:CHAT domain-containing protein [Thermomicrobiales bacterium]
LAADPTAPAVIVHSPQLPQQLLETLKTTAPTWTVRPPDAAAPEIARITKAPAEPAPIVLSGADATLDKLKSAAAGLRRGGRAERAATGSGEGLTFSSGANQGLGPLHLAAPFRINSASPLFSPLLLAAPATVIKEGAPASAVPDDFEVRQLFNMDPLASVVLFSDPGALSKRDAAASTDTVAWAWRSSGTSTVIFRRWGGNDVTATEMMGRFYEALRGGTPPAEALQAARAAVRQTEPGRAPAAWAGWVILTGR